MKRVLITGGAGFIGSHLVERLVETHEVQVLDDLSGGNLNNLQPYLKQKRISFLEGSITSGEDIRKSLDGVDLVFHFAAQPNVRLSVENPLYDFEINVRGTLTLLEEMRCKDIDQIIFASSGGTIYGDAEILPTPESTRLHPISNYGAAKAAIEMYLSSYAELYGLNSICLRLANIIGPRCNRGVIFDFYMKLKRDSNNLEILGDGNQEKSYLYVDDTIDAIQILSEKMESGYLPINIASYDCLTVTRIAEIICDQLELSDVNFNYTGTRRGWSGDVVKTAFDISLATSFGWAQKTSLEEAVRFHVDWLVETLGAV